MVEQMGKVFGFGEFAGQVVLQGIRVKVVFTKGDKLRPVGRGFVEPDEVSQKGGQENGNVLQRTGRGWINVIF